MEIQTFCTCIIPFFNEGDRILNVLDIVSKEKSVSQIICVDDGSTDGVAQHIQQLFPQVLVIQLKRNKGKAAAVAAGLKKASAGVVFLLDADLRGLKTGEIDNTMRYFQQHPELTMIIWRRMHAPFITKFNRSDILFSGERVLRKEDLEAAFALNPVGFQLEAAINNHIQQHHKKAVWMPSTVRNTYKIQKYGLFKGLWKELQMSRNIMHFLGFRNYLRQVMTFCTQKISY